MPTPKSRRTDGKPWAVREAAPADVGVVLDVIDRTYAPRSHPYREEIRERIASGEVTAFYGEWHESGSTPVPFATASVIPNAGRTRFEFGWLAIHPEYRGASHDDTTPLDDLLARLRAHVDATDVLFTTNCVTTNAKTQHIDNKRGYVPVKITPFEDPDMFGTGYRESGILFVRPGATLAGNPTVHVPDGAVDLVRRNLDALPSVDRAVSTDEQTDQDVTLLLDVERSDARGHASIHCVTVDGDADERVSVADAATQIRRLFAEPDYPVVELLIDVNRPGSTSLLDAIAGTNPMLTGFVPSYLDANAGTPRDVLSYVHLTRGPDRRFTAPMQLVPECFELLVHTDLWRAGWIDVGARERVSPSVSYTNLELSTRGSLP